MAQQAHYPMAQQAHYPAETQLIRRVAVDPHCSWEFRGHSLKRMAERNITQADIQRVLTKGQIDSKQLSKDVLLRVKGSDVDDRPIEVVVAVFEDPPRVKVITVIDVSASGR
jgi:hypothetical protein